MNSNENFEIDSIVLNFDLSGVRVVWGDLFAFEGLKAIPISRHLFETAVAERSLLQQVLYRFRQTDPQKGLEKYEKALQDAIQNKDFERAPAALGFTRTEPPKQEQLSKLRLILSNRFNNDELQDLCFDLGISYDDLPGNNISGKARELISRLERHDRILELIRTGEQLRPDIRWVEIFQVSNEVPLLERLYPLGTTVLVEREEDKFLLFAITWTELKGYIPDDNCNVTKMWLALEKFWHETRKYALGHDVNIPLIGSGITGINMTPFHLLQLNLLAIQNAITAKGKITTGEIRIILYPPAHSGIDLALVKQIWEQT